MPKFEFVINTDASHDSKTGIATWAYWIKTKKDLYTQVGVFDRPIKDNNIAELLAFERALRKVEAHTTKRWTAKLVIYTDSMFVIKSLKGELRHPLSLAVKHATKGYDMELIHVKSHGSDLSEGSTTINDWCDRHARKLLREELGR